MNRSQWVRGDHWTQRVPEINIETKFSGDMKPTGFDKDGNPIVWTETVQINIQQFLPEFHEKK
jgi:hypothetical protein